MTMLDTVVMVGGIMKTQYEYFSENIPTFAQNLYPFGKAGITRVEKNRKMAYGILL